MKTVALALTLLTIQASVEAQWVTKKSTTPPKEAALQQPSWFIQADYLYWKVQQEDLFYGIHTSSSGSRTSQQLKLTPLQPNFGWNSGARVGFGGYTNERWDITAKATYIYSDAKNESHGNAKLAIDKGFPAPGTFIFPAWASQILGFSDKSKALWKNNFFIYDLLMGRKYLLANALTIHPFFGLRGFNMFQHYNCIYSGVVNGSGQDPAPTASFPIVGKVKMENKTYGVGPRLGVDLGYRFTESLSAVGGVSAAILYSHYDATNKLTAFTVEQGVLATLNGKTGDSNQIGRTNIDAYVGFDWIKSFNRGKNNFKIGLLFETSYWFGLNQFMDYLTVETGGNGNNSTAGYVSMYPEKRHGDLSYMGGTLQFQFDF